MNISPAELDQIKDDIAEGVADRLSQRPRLVNREEMAKQLGISIPTLDRLKATEAIPCVRIGSSVRYEPEAVMQALRG